MTLQEIITLIGYENEHLLTHSCKTINRESLQIPSKDFIDKVFTISNRNPQTLRNLAALLNFGRLSGTGYLSIIGCLILIYAWESN